MSEVTAIPEGSTEPVAKNDDKNVVIKFELPKVEKDKTYSADEVQKIIDNAVQGGQKIAKEQLYDEIDRLKEKVKVVNDQLKTNKVEPAEIQKLVEEKSLYEKKVSALEESVVSSGKKLEQLESDLKQKELDTYKLQKINSAEGKIINEMVSGNTKEEIDASIEKAKAKYVDLQNELRQKFNLPTESVEGSKPENKVVEKINIPRLKGKADLSSWSADREKYLKMVYEPLGLKLD